MELSSLAYLSEAIEKGKEVKPIVKTRTVPVEISVGLYAAEDILAPQDFPPYERSAVDGFAVRANETISSSRINPAAFKIIGEITASSVPSLIVKKGEAVRISTGGPIPKGADSVVMKEEAEEDGDQVRVFSPVRRFQNVSRRGEDLKKGMIILKQGTRINPAHIAALIECGIREVKVYDISIGILSTGDELVSGLVANSTQPFIKSLLESKGFEVTSHGTVRDEPSLISEAIREMKEDIMIVTGGSGPGKMDLVPELVAAKGRLLFRGLRIRPGRTTGLGVVDGRPLFMISGLPVAALIAVENIITKLIALWYNLSLEKSVLVTGRLERSIVNPVGVRSYVRVKVVEEGGTTVIVPTRTTGSGVIYSILDSQGILEIEENSEGIEAGAEVAVRLLRWW
ncbi:MAG: molybdopterin molybdotransferase MoeA [Thermoplasmata archaeon]